MPLRFGLNRLDLSSPTAFAEDAVRLEAQGWDYGFIPSSPLLVRDPYINIVEALKATTTFRLGPLIENPVMRHPAVIAGSIATVDQFSPGRVLLGMGVGDTAVRLMGRKPATIKRLEEAIRVMRALLDGEGVEVAAARPARLRHAMPVPIYVAAGGPRTLEMAGRVADGVFIRVGTDRRLLEHAVGCVRHGEVAAGREAGSVRICAVFHTVFGRDDDRSRAIARSIAAGYYEYSPMLFEQAGIEWNGPDVETLRESVWPDFHHTSDLEKAGHMVGFLGRDAEHAFSLVGDADAIAERLDSIDKYDLGIDVVVPHPMPTAPTGPGDYAERFARDVIARLK